MLEMQHCPHPPLLTVFRHRRSRPRTSLMRSALILLLWLTSTESKLISMLRLELT